VQSAGGHAVRQSVSADSGLTQLLQVDMPMLTFGQARDLAIAPALDQLKLTNRPAQPRFLNRGSILGIGLHIRP
jgi:hypothetical protein